MSGIGTSSPASEATMPTTKTPLITLPKRRTNMEKTRVMLSSMFSGIIAMLGAAKDLR